jgi:hypothetical protein
MWRAGNTDYGEPKCHFLGWENVGQQDVCACDDEHQLKAVELLRPS